MLSTQSQVLGQNRWQKPGFLGKTGFLLCPLARAGVEDPTWQVFELVTVEGEPVADVAEKP